MSTDCPMLFFLLVLCDSLSRSGLKTCNGEVFGHWTVCPPTVTAYAGCIAKIHSLFHIQPNNTINLTSCLDKNLMVTIFLNASINVCPDENVCLVEKHKADSDSETVCEVFASFNNTNVNDIYNVRFLVKYVDTHGSNPIFKDCLQHLQVKAAHVPNPAVNGTTITCEGVLVQWSPPVLNSTTVAVEGYTVYIPGTTLSYDTTSANTSLLIPYTDGLEYNTQYIATIYAIYCGGEAGNEINTTFTTAMAPQIERKLANEIITLNISFVNLTSTVQISSTECLASYPKTIHAAINCTAITGQVQNTVNASVNPDDGTIQIHTVLPIDTVCTVSLTFNNKGLTTTIDPFNADTRQLEKCSFMLLSNQQDISISCFFASFSSLNGCRGVVIDMTNEWNTTVDILKDDNYEYPVTNVALNGKGKYRATCFGLTKSSDGVIIVTYNDLSHHSIITINATAPSNGDESIELTAIISGGVSCVIFVCIVLMVFTGLILYLFFKKTKRNVRFSDDMEMRKADILVLPEDGPPRVLVGSMPTEKEIEELKKKNPEIFENMEKNWLNTQSNPA